MLKHSLWVLLIVFGCHSAQAGTPVAAVLTSALSATDSPVSAVRYVLSGTIKDVNGNPIPNVFVVCSNNCSVQTDRNGVFRLGFKPSWSITVTPESDTYNFSPKSISIRRLKQDTTQDFIATSVIAPPPPPVVGACCIPVGTSIVNCSVLTLDDCTKSGGVYKGNNTTCNSGTICPPPVPPEVTGACCTVVSNVVSCQNITLSGCGSVGGTYKGDGTSCQTPNICPNIVPPPALTGACCILLSPTTMSCQTISQTNCSTAGGTYKGDGTTCSTSGICPTPTPPPPSSTLPIAVDQNLFTQIDQPKAFAFSAAPAGKPTNPISIQLTKMPSNGQLYQQDGSTVGKLQPFTTGVVPFTLFYVPNAGFVGTDNLKFVATENSVDSSAGTITFNVQSNADYVMPIGIPAPPFGIKETVASVYGSKDFFTHYVDPNNPSSTDGSNPNGTLAKPRKSIPSNVPAGSVVAIKGGVFNTLLAVTSAGTATQPIFYRGLDPLNKPLLKQKLAVEGTAKYIIFENIALDRDNLSSGVNITAGSFICMRNCDFAEGQQAVIITNNISNIVQLNNYVHDCGNMDGTTDTDENGYSVSSGVGTWLLDNLVTRVAGSGMVTNTGYGNPNSAVQNVYMGRNVVYRSRQSGMWTKQATHCVFSQNLVFSIVGTSWAQSMGFGYQYGPEDVWFIFNRAFNCEYGIGTGSNSSTNPGQNQYIIGNIFHRIRPWNGNVGGNGSWDSSAIMLAGGVKRYIANNTIYDCSAGINCPDSGSTKSFTIVNNIIANMTGSGNHVWVQDESGGTTWSVNNNVFGQPNVPVKIKFQNTAYSVAQLQSQFGSNAKNNKETDPMLVNPAYSNFRLSSGSQAINNGTGLTILQEYLNIYGTSIDVDFLGNQRVGGIDIGALEYIP